LLIFQHFCVCLSEHITNADKARHDINTLAYTMVLGHFKEIGRKYHEEISSFVPTMESLLFSDVDHRVLEVWHQIKSLIFREHPNVHMET